MFFPEIRLGKTKGLKRQRAWTDITGYREPNSEAFLCSAKCCKEFLKNGRFMIYCFLGIGFIQQTTNMHTVGAVHERPGSTRSVFRIRLGAFAGRGPCRRAIRESPLQSYREACCVKPIPIKNFTPNGKRFVPPENGCPHNASCRQLFL